MPKVTEKKHVVLIPPAFCTMSLMEPIMDYLTHAGYCVHLVKYPGHFDDEDDVSQHTLDTYYQKTLRTIEVVETIISSEISAQEPNGRIYLVGFSQGAVIAHKCAQANPSRFAGVTMYGSPQMGGLPVWKTLRTIIFNSKYRKPILGKKDRVTLSVKDARNLLFNGRKFRDIPDICTVPAGGKVLAELLSDRMTPNQHEKLPYTVIRASEEKFHSNGAAKKWANRSKNCSYFEVDGSHFGLLYSIELLDLISKTIETAFDFHAEKSSQGIFHARTGAVGDENVHRIPETDSLAFKNVLMP